MGKSLGNFTTLKDAFAKWNPQVVRFFILQSHYRSTLDFSAAAVEGAAKGLERLNNTRRNLRDRIMSAGKDGQVVSLDLAHVKATFMAAMDDDFNTPQAVAVLFDLARDVNQLLASGASHGAASLQAIEDLFEELGGTVLGVAPPGERGGMSQGREPQLIELLIDLRKEIRAQKLWALSDRIRDGLAKIGIVLEDRKEGTTWKA